MPTLTGKRKRYRLGGDFSIRDRDGEQLEHHFVSGDLLPDEIAAALTAGEIAANVGRGLFREIGAAPPPKPVVEPPKPLNAAQIMRHTGWPAASVSGGRVTDGPRGYAITVMDKAARDSDLREVLPAVGETVVVVHRVGGELVATLSMTRFARLLASATFGVR